MTLALNNKKSNLYYRSYHFSVEHLVHVSRCITLCFLNLFFSVYTVLNLSVEPLPSREPHPETSTTSWLDKFNGQSISLPQEYASEVEDRFDLEHVRKTGRRSREIAYRSLAVVLESNSDSDPVDGIVYVDNEDVFRVPGTILREIVFDLDSMRKSVQSMERELSVSQSRYELRIEHLEKDLSLERQNTNSSRDSLSLLQSELEEVRKTLDRRDARCRSLERTLHHLTHPKHVTPTWLLSTDAFELGGFDIENNMTERKSSSLSSDIIDSMGIHTSSASTNSVLNTTVLSSPSSVERSLCDLKESERVIRLKARISELEKTLQQYEWSLRKFFLF